jgi:hypothetical protein
VEGLEGIIKAKKNGSGKRGGIKDIPVARPDPVRKSWKSIWLLHSDNHGISVLDPRVHEGPAVIVGPDMKRGWSVKPSLAPRKVEGLGSIVKARHGSGKGMAFGAVNS